MKIKFSGDAYIQKNSIGPADDMAAKLDEISKILALECREEIPEAVPGSFLDEFDALNVEVSFRRAACVSAAYSMMSRYNRILPA